MDVHPLGNRDRRSEKLALNGLRMVLAVVFSALGWGFLFAPRLAEDLAHGGYGTGFRYLLGASHLAVGDRTSAPASR
jgi:hypothetical protein